MSILIASGANNGLDATTHLSSSVSCTKMVWVKHAAPPGAYNPILSSITGSGTSYAELWGGDGAGILNIHSNSAIADFTSQPTWANWTCFAMTMTAAGANSLIAYWQDNAGGGFTSKSVTGASFTNGHDSIAARGTVQVGMTMAYYKEWNTVLTPTQLQAEFLSATPVITGASLSRYLVMSNAASAGTDTSGNGFNMSAVGSIADGVGLPNFPVAAINLPKRLPRRIFSTTYFG